MYGKALSIFYGLSILVLGAALFVMQPAARPEVAELQHIMQRQFTVALIQTFGDQSFFKEVSDVYGGVASFYNQAATATIALLNSPNADADIAYVFGQAYHNVAIAVHSANTQPLTPTLQIPADKFMTEAPIYNLVPRPVVQASTTGSIAGAATTPWITMTDGLTGQKYCVALYNGEVNKYLGACPNDYH